MISVLVQNGHSEHALALLAELHRLGIEPSVSSLTSALFACANMGSVEVENRYTRMSLNEVVNLIHILGMG